MLAAALVGLVASGVIPQVVSATVPYRMPYDRQAREFARRFWPEQGRDAELACAHLDFGIDPPGVWRGRQAWYLCNQAIYSPQRREHGWPRLGLVSADRPLRCVRRPYRGTETRRFAARPDNRWGVHRSVNARSGSCMHPAT